MADPGLVARRRRSLRRAGRVLILCGLVLVLVGVYLTRPPGPVGRAQAAGGGGGGGRNLPALNVTLNLTDAPAFTPNVLNLPVSTAISLDLKNVGTFNHTFTLLATQGFSLNRSWDPAQLDGWFHANGSQVNVSVAPGTSTIVNLTFVGEQAGFSFEFVSIVPYQFQAGMFGFLNVTGPPSGPGQVVDVATSATQLLFDPSVLAVNATTYPVTVDIAVSNMGSNDHTFWLASQPNVTLDPGNFSTYFDQHPPLASLNVPTSPGTTVWANVTIKAPGVYQYICTVPGHFAAGMTGYLYVGVPPPAVAPPPSTAIVNVWILWGGAGVLALGTLLSAVALLVGRFPRPPATGGH